MPKLSDNYQAHYEQLRAHSPFLNERTRSRDLHQSGWTLESRNQLMNRVQEYEEKIIPELSENVKLIKEDFKKFQDQKVADGYKRPSQMSEELQERFDLASAMLNIAFEEKWAIQRLADTKTVKEARRKDHEFLRYGPRGVVLGRITETSGEVDGQQARLVNGIPTITDKRSPWHLMSVADYREYVCKPWKLERAKLQEKRYQEAILKGIPLGKLGGRREPKLPGWPDEVSRPKIKAVPKAGND